MNEFWVSQRPQSPAKFFFNNSLRSSRTLRETLGLLLEGKTTCLAEAAKTAKIFFNPFLCVLSVLCEKLLQMVLILEND